jgi:hypothetical protein
LSDAKFLDAAKDLIARRLREYNQSLVPATTDTQDPVSAPQPSVQEPSKPSQDEPSSDVTTFLAFRCEQADELSSILDTLDSLNAPALFFFTPQLLEEQDDLVRRILGGGHAVGILAEGSSLSETRELLSEGNRLLSALTYTRTTLVYAPKEQRSALSEDGWVCWSETLHLSPASNVSSANFAYQTTNRLSGRTKNTYLTLDCDANAARVLSNLLRQLSAKHFIVSVPLETKL